ncbi:MAG: aminotransferase class IV family protein [Sphingobacteriales bacterium]|nr:aminotransferase class IV family protein [Sphingobacteriales bacterium]
MLFYNNTFIAPEQLHLSPGNRSFRYGDGLFESMVMFNNRVPLLPQHYSRLCSGMKQLKMSFPAEWSVNYLYEICAKLAYIKQFTNARIRLQITRIDGGLYAPISNEVNILLEMQPIAYNHFELNPNGLHIGVYSDARKTQHFLSALKTANALPYVMAAIYAKENNFDECVLLNEKNTIADTGKCNLFVLKNNYLITPPIADGGVDGVMRQTIFTLIGNKKPTNSNLQLLEQSLTIADVESADEVFLTNAVNGIQWVRMFKHCQFNTHKTSTSLTQIINQHIAHNR